MSFPFFHPSVLVAIEYLRRNNIPLPLLLPSLLPHEGSHLLHAWSRDVYGGELYLPGGQHHLDHLLVVLYLHQVSIV